jgi:uncharacterized protein YndB with AHSA1/START domain
MRIGMIAALACALAAGAARAEVVDSTPGGFEVKQTVTIAAPASAVWTALLKPDQWWNGKHSWSGEAHNLSLDARVGGCWCETLPNGGGVEHMRVVFLAPGKVIRFQGGLGPFQMSGADGRLAWMLAETDGKTTLTWTYDLGGYMKGGLQPMAAPVDGVLAEQIARLKAYIETGKPQ